MTEELPAPEPPVTPETERFWDATLEGELLVRECGECSRVYHYPRKHCPDCASPNTEWIVSSGRGTVYSFTVSHQGGGEYVDSTPFVLAYVELEEGPRIMTNIVNCEPDSVSIGHSVSVVFHDTGGEAALPRFELRD